MSKILEMLFANTFDNNNLIKIRCVFQNIIGILVVNDYKVSKFYNIIVNFIFLFHY